MRSCLLPKLLIIVFYLTSINADAPSSEETTENCTVYKNLTIFDLQNIFEIEMEGDEDSLYASRLFPVCISPKILQNYNLDLRRFASVFGAMDKLYDKKTKPLPYFKFNTNNHSTGGRTDWIRDIKLSRINSDDIDARNMRQWIHITVVPAIELKGLYIQPISGPLGLSSGEFSLEFNCIDVQANLKENAIVMHCDYRSRADIYHPTAVFVGVNKPFQEAHMHYRFTDITCLETPYLQFLVIAIKEFSDNPTIDVDYLPLLSPVFTNFDFDSVDGVITPYYMDWADKMHCLQTSHLPIWKHSTKLYHDTAFVPLKWKVSTELQQILFNTDYDKCLTGFDTTDRDEIRKECPPGPFECPSYLSLNKFTDDFNSLVTRRADDVRELAQAQHCFLCYFFPKEEFSDICSTYKQQQNDEKDVDKIHSELLDTPNGAKHHGGVALLAFLIISPVANFVGRFYRGTTPVNCCQSCDIWIILHAVLQIISWILMWVSISLVPSSYEGLSFAESCYMNGVRKNGKKWLENCIDEKLFPSSHVGFGMLTFILHHVLIFTASSRHHKIHIRNIQVIVHSHLGYTTYIFAVVAAFTIGSRSCFEVILWLGCLFLVTIFATAIGLCITVLEDRNIRINPRRNQWPILEYVMLTHPGPYHHHKLLLLMSYVGVLLIIWALAITSFALIHTSELSVLIGLEDQTTIWGLFSCRDSIRNSE